jgi:hypothetical protein
VIQASDGEHAMPRRHRTFDGLAADLAAATLLDEPSADPHSAPGRILAGASSTVA